MLELAEPRVSAIKVAGMNMLEPTPIEDNLARRYSDFETLGEALDYAARGVRGLNFHDARGTLVRPYCFSELRDDALECLARSLVGMGLRGGLALVGPAEAAHGDLPAVDSLPEAAFGPVGRNDHRW